MKDEQLNADITRNWVLPRWNPRSGTAQRTDPNRRRLEALLGEEGITSSQNNAALIRGNVVKNQGGSASEILDAMENNRFIVKSSTGGAVTKYFPDFRTALKTIEGVRPGDIGGVAEEMLLMKAPSDASGMVLETQETHYATLRWSGGKWLIDYEGNA